MRTSISSWRIRPLVSPRIAASNRSRSDGCTRESQARRLMRPVASSIAVPSPTSIRQRTSRAMVRARGKGSDHHSTWSRWSWGAAGGSAERAPRGEGPRSRVADSRDQVHPESSSPTRSTAVPRIPSPARRRAAYRRCRSAGWTASASRRPTSIPAAGLTRSSAPSPSQSTIGRAEASTC